MDFKGFDNENSNFKSVRGYEQYSDPYNLINGFPNGLRNHIQSLLEVPN